MRTPSLIHRWDHLPSILSVVAFPQKKLLFAGTQDSKILCFDLDLYTLIKTISLADKNDANHTKSSVLCLTKSKDEEYLFSAGADSLVRIWSVEYTNDVDCSVRVQELLIAYSFTDIGDIFSLNYLDEQQTLIFGCQNASMLYVQNIFKKVSKESNDINRLPQRRYNKFFDSQGVDCNSDNFIPNFEKFEGFDNGYSILEVPSENIISYAHNGFVYSICQLDIKNGPIPEHFKLFTQSLDTEFVVSGGSDGVSKIWALQNDIQIGGMKLITQIDNEEAIISQFAEFPFLYCGLSGGKIKIWDLTTNQLISTLKTLDNLDILSINVYVDNLFVTQRKCITQFYKDHMYHWKGHEGLILVNEILQYSHDNNDNIRLVTGGDDKTLALWDINELINKSLCTPNTDVCHKYTSNGRKLLAKDEVNKLSNEHMIKTLQELISFQTISEKPGTQQILDTRRCAIFLQGLLIKLGAHSSQLLSLKSGGNPIVFGHFKSEFPNAKKLVWYGHYDVVSPGISQHWNTDPFSLTCENGYMKGRGVSDNKGPLIAVIYSVAELIKNQKLKNDVIFLIEGQEEIGSLGFEATLREHKHLIGNNVDWILFSNSYWMDDKIPCLNYGLRGVINTKITIYSNEPDRHSGVDGGVHREPASDLITLISKLQDDDGNVLIPGFYDSLKELSQDELKNFEDVINRVNFDELITVEQLIAKWTKPSLSITTIQMSGPGNLTIIPKKVSMCVSIRVAPEQDTLKLKKSLEHYITSCFNKLSTKNHLQIKCLNIAEPWLGNTKNAAYKLIREEVKHAWNIDPLLIREGGSIPCINFLEKFLNAPAIQIPCGQSTDNAHLNNEQLRIVNWYKMRHILTNVFTKL